MSTKPAIDDGLWFEEPEMDGWPMQNDLTNGRVGGLWRKWHPKIGSYFWGTINGKPVVVLKNQRKEPGDDPAPDWCVYRGKPRRKFRNVTWGKNGLGEVR
jgi:hypothetical protein